MVEKKKDCKKERNGRGQICLQDIFNKINKLTLIEERKRKKNLFNHYWKGLVTAVSRLPNIIILFC